MARHEPSRKARDPRSTGQVPHCGAKLPGSLPLLSSHSRQIITTATKLRQEHKSLAVEAIPASYGKVSSVRRQGSQFNHSSLVPEGILNSPSAFLAEIVRWLKAGSMQPADPLPRLP
jgi:hypothetical protein